MAMAKEQQKIPDDSRVNILSSIIRLGHESFKKNDLAAKSVHILNNSKLVSNYDRSCLIDNRGVFPKIIGVTGEESVNQNSEYVLLIKDLIFPILPSINKPSELSSEFIKTLPNSDKIALLYEKYLSINSGATVLLIPMMPPEGGTESFMWIIEYFSPIAETEKNKMGLLAQNYSESLWYCVNSSKNIHKSWEKNSKFSIGKIILFSCLTLLLILFTYRVNLNVPSDFELMPSVSEVDYAPFAGKIAEVLVKNGENVKKDQVLIKYDTQELIYSLSESQIAYNETLAKLDMTRQKSFKDEAILPEIKILELQKEKDKVGIEKIKWYIDNSIIKSKASGTAVIDDEKNLEGKAVNAGEKLVEVVSNDNLLAEIMLNEKDAAVLEKISSITLYLHSRPENGIKASVISVSPKAEFADNKQFCFLIKASFNKNDEKDLVYGMRGIARVSGNEVSLGYYLTRNILLWWRKV